MTNSADPEQLASEEQTSINSFSLLQNQSELLLVIHPMTSIHYDLGYGKFIPCLTKEVNVATPSSAPSVEGIIESGRA